MVNTRGMERPAPFVWAEVAERDIAEEAGFMGLFGEWMKIPYIVCRGTTNPNILYRRAVLKNRRASVVPKNRRRRSVRQLHENSKRNFLFNNVLQHVCGLVKRNFCVHAQYHTFFHPIAYEKTFAARLRIGPATSNATAICHAGTKSGNPTSNAPTT